MLTVGLQIQGVWQHMNAPTDAGGKQCQETLLGVGQLTGCVKASALSSKAAGTCRMPWRQW